MMKSSWDFARLLKTVSEVRQNQHINDNDRIAMLREMQAQLPDAMFAQQAIAQSGKDVPLEIAVISVDGTRKD